jgi:hypothetical protein
VSINTGCTVINTEIRTGILFCRINVSCHNLFHEEKVLFWNALSWSGPTLLRNVSNSLLMYTVQHHTRLESSWTPLEGLHISCLISRHHSTLISSLNCFCFVVRPCTERCYNCIIKTALRKWYAGVHTDIIWRRIGGAIDGEHLWKLWRTFEFHKRQMTSLWGSWLPAS